MGRLIDTSIFVESERRRIDLEAYLAARADEDYFMSVITASELLHGVHRASTAYKKSRSITIETWIAQFALLEIDLPVARFHSQLWAELESSGQIIGPHDLWLAATCLAHGLIMVTANVREFIRVPGLEVENWSQA